MKFSFENIALRRSGLTILDDLSFKIDQGKSILVSGSNGSGKSSLLLYLAGVLKDENDDVVAQEFSDECLLIESTLPLKRDLTVWENMETWLYLWDNGLFASKDEMSSILKRFGLKDVLDVPVKNLSSGQQKKVWYSQLWLRPQKIWLLDEPSTNLDKEALQVLSEAINIHCKVVGGIVICAEHQTDWFPFDREINLDQTQQKKGRKK